MKLGVNMVKGCPEAYTEAAITGINIHRSSSLIKNHCTLFGSLLL